MRWRSLSSYTGRTWTTFNRKLDIGGHSPLWVLSIDCTRHNNKDQRHRGAYRGAEETAISAINARKRSAACRSLCIIMSHCVGRPEYFDLPTIRKSTIKSRTYRVEHYEEEKKMRDNKVLLIIVDGEKTPIFPMTPAFNYRRFACRSVEHVRLEYSNRFSMRTLAERCCASIRQDVNQWASIIIYFGRLIILSF